MKYLLIANVAVFFAMFILQDAMGENFRWFIHIFGLNPAWVLRGAIWQFVTYMFLHGDFWHLAFNMLWLWMFGCSLEADWGSRPFLNYYFFTGIAAGVVNFLATIGSNVPTIGASGAIFGIIVAYAMAYPNRLIYIWMLFPVKVKYFAIFAVGINLYAVVQSTAPHASPVAHFAHLGGALFGYLYLKFGDRVRFSLPRIRLNTRSRTGNKAGDWHNFMRSEVDPI
ncbi:MAG: rhomboid family intramembrane serine protease, partial [Candidatus Abyssubacteria bacterium]|nr:rhomboid family intramembrane serine protease [Candidatus Abyssubacteria bacterium]